MSGVGDRRRIDGACRRPRPAAHDALQRQPAAVADAELPDARFGVVAARRREAALARRSGRTRDSVAWIDVNGADGECSGGARGGWL